jgi:hypothetical protein
VDAVVVGAGRERVKVMKHNGRASVRIWVEHEPDGELVSTARGVSLPLDAAEGVGRALLGLAFAELDGDDLPFPVGPPPARRPRPGNPLPLCRWIALSRKAGWTLQQLADRLNNERCLTPTGKAWTSSLVQQASRRGGYKTGK